jgi:DHA2 family multidrug resistance protein-like MFS transporter
MIGADLKGLSETQAQAVSATLAGAVETARSLADPSSVPWLQTAKDSFSVAFAICCVVATATLMLLAVIAAKVYARAPIDEDALALRH